MTTSKTLSIALIASLATSSAVFAATTKVSVDKDDLLKVVSALEHAPTMPESKLLIEDLALRRLQRAELIEAADKLFDERVDAIVYDAYDTSCTEIDIGSEGSFSVYGCDYPCSPTGGHGVLACMTDIQQNNMTNDCIAVNSAMDQCVNNGGSPDACGNAVNEAAVEARLAASVEGCEEEYGVSGWEAAEFCGFFDEVVCN